MAVRYPEIVVECNEGVLRVRFHRAVRGDLITTRTLHALADLLCDTRHDRTVRAIVVAGTVYSFCAGVEIGDTSQSSDIVIAAAGEALERVVEAMVAFPRPVIGAVNGLAAGAGLALALACDVTVASDSSEFSIAQSEWRYGPHASIAAVLTARAIGRNRALRMSLLGETLTARAALEEGLIGGVYPTARFKQHVETFVRQIAP
ncbi:enoyl-CoA hydratase-related protein [Rhodococcus sp. JVH1]|uniref:enoyl-CoA hydratase-related protein n=1 Tax=Rhodococcus sp. JVH1 TaxID=745408 RepID=UPI000271F866|nr:enoyl-CoA hydratase-related protein [Rhodococcus sp. JVH1]EJJ01670.1 enoyl-CoA hydratase/isomerase family protein [Rhodococcus sp. JVH1]